MPEFFSQGEVVKFSNREMGWSRFIDSVDTDTDIDVLILKIAKTYQLHGQWSLSRLRLRLRFNS